MSSRPTGHDPRLVADEVDDGRPPLRVARGRDDAERLVQQDVASSCFPTALAVDLDDVARRHERVQLARLAVDGHAAGLDQLVRRPARGDPGPGEDSGSVACRGLSLVSRAVRDYADWTERLADLIVGFGANVQPGQLVGVTSYIGKEG